MAEEQLSIVASLIDNVSTGAAKIEKSIGGIEKATGRLERLVRGGSQHINAFLQGAGIGIGIGSFYALERALGRVVRIIPDLIGKGERWAGVIDGISDSTGLASEHASELAAVQTYVGGTTDSLGRSLNVLAKNAVTNEKAFEQLGITTRDANGNLLDSWTLFQNVRKAISEGGNSLLSTAAAQKVFGRGASDLLDLLTLSNEQWRLYADEAKRAGLILDEAGVHAAEQWERTKNVLDGAISGIGAQVLERASPALISLTNGITNAIHDNMDNIVRFVVQTVNFVAGLIGGFLGIDFGAVTLADQIDKAGNKADQASDKFNRLGDSQKTAASGEDKFTTALQREIDALDRKLAALDRVSRREDARRQMRQVLADVQAAKADLAAVEMETIFAAGMSDADAELARQAQAADVVDAEKRLAAARRKLRETQRDQRLAEERQELQDRRANLQQQLADHRKQLAAVLSANTVAVQQLKDTWSGKGKDSPFSGLTADMKKSAEDARKFGEQIATSIRTAIFGTDTTVPGSQFFGGDGIKIHQEGLLDKLGHVADFLSDVYDVIGGPNQLTDQVKLLIIALGASKGASLLSSLLGLGGGAALGAGGTAAVQGTLLKLLTGSGGLLAGLKLLPVSLFGSQPDTMTVPQPGDPNYGEGGQFSWITENIMNALGGQSNGSGFYHGSDVGGFTGGGQLYGFSQVLEQKLRRYLGDSAPLLTSQQDQQDLLDAVANNTNVLPDGSLITTMPDGTVIKTNVSDWNAGTMPTQIKDWLANQNVGTKINNNSIPTTVGNTPGVTIQDVAPGIGHNLPVSATKGHPVSVKAKVSYDITTDGSGVEHARGNFIPSRRGRLGLTSGTEFHGDYMFGEAGTEGVAIIRHPRSGNFGSGGNELLEVMKEILRILRAGLKVEFSADQMRRLNGGQMVSSTTRAVT